MGNGGQRHFVFPFYPPGVSFFSARKLDFVATMTVWAGHFTESAGTQANPCRRAWHLNWPMLSVAGTQASPHALSRHGQTIFTQLLGKIVCAY